MPIMIRPPYEKIASIQGLIVCSCGTILATLEQSRQHWQIGHFDYLSKSEREAELEARLAAAEAALQSCGIGGIYADFDGDLADAIEQMTHFIKEQSKQLAAAEAQLINELADVRTKAALRHTLLRSRLAAAEQRAERLAAALDQFTDPEPLIIEGEEHGE